MTDLRTVTIRTRDYPEERQFHLSPDKASRFAAKVIAEGGTADVGPLAIGGELAALLSRLNVSPA